MSGSDSHPLDLGYYLDLSPERARTVDNMLSITADLRSAMPDLSSIAPLTLRAVEAAMPPRKSSVREAATPPNNEEKCEAAMRQRHSEGEGAARPRNSGNKRKAVRPQPSGTGTAGSETKVAKPPKHSSKERECPDVSSSGSG